MPTILHADGYDGQIFTQDHLPPHVHVFATGCEAIVHLNCLDSFVTLRDNFRFRARELKDILLLVQANRLMLCEEWEKIHGKRS
jgi:hypothetical protein